MSSKSFFFLFLLILYTTGAHAFNLKADLELEVRQFQDDDNKETFENQRALKAHLEGSHSWGATQLDFSFNYRYDDQDYFRNIFWSEKTKLKTELFRNFWVSFGTEIFNHSYMEAFHSLDVGNARIIDLSLVNSEKIGEPFIGFQTILFDGDLTFSLTPMPADPRLPGKNSRLNLPQNLNKAIWLDENGETNSTEDYFILTYEKTFDNFDLLLLTTKGVDRSRFSSGTLNFIEIGGSPFPLETDLFTPYYYERTLSGATSVYNFDSFQLKASLAHTHYLSSQEVLSARSSTDFFLSRPQDHTAWTFGFEKPISLGDGVESTLFVEYQYIDIGKEDRASFALQNDLFVAWRVEFNDIDNKVLTLSTLFDLGQEQDDGLIQVSYSQRIKNSWRVELSVVDYFISESERISGFSFLQNQEHASMKVKYFF